METAMDLLSRYEAGERNFSYANLTGANLSDADLTGANLTYANLTDANLTGANLSDADLSDANLTDADLTDADLTGANLTGANLANADLRGANLRYKIIGASRHTLIATQGQIQIGCIVLPADQWLARYEELGRKYNYTSEQVEEYGYLIKLLAGEVSQK
jgi:hypothetical protein